MNPSLYWNDVALETNRERHTNKAKEQSRPPLSARALAIVHLAMYDTYAGVSGSPSDLPANLPELPLAPAGVSTTAAVAGQHTPPSCRCIPPTRRRSTSRWSRRPSLGTRWR